MTPARHPILLPLLLVLPLALTACETPAALFPGLEIGQAARDPAYTQRRGAVELHVKSNHVAILTEMANGGGPNLSRAFDLAEVPEAHRPGRLVQLEGDRALYEANPGALVSTLMVYGGQR